MRTLVAMTKPAIAPRAPVKFDLSKLEGMVEPFNVRVEKIKGSMRYGIPLMPSEAGPPGTGWSKDQVREIESWLVNEWSGGGHYNISIVDSSNQAMDWVAYYPVSEFPEKTPPTLQSGAAFAPAPPPSTQVKTMAQFPGGSSLPPASLYGGSLPMPQPQPQLHTGFYSAPMPYGYGYAPAPQQASNNEVRALQDALAQAREQAAQREFERRLAEIKADSDRRIVELQQMMQQLVERMTQQLATAKPVVDPMIETIREENRRLQQQIEQSNRERREAELQAQIRSTQEETRRLVEESNRRYEVFMREAANKGPDQQMLLFQQMFQSQTEAMKEIARTSQSQLDRVQNFMMRPQDVLAIAKESSTGADQVAMNMNRAWEQMFGISRQLTEQAAQLNQGGGNEVVGLVRDAAGKLGEWAEKYTGGKTKEAVASMNAQAEIARAQSEAIKSQQERMAQMAQIEAALKTGAVVQMPNGTFVAPSAVPQSAIAAGSAPVPANGHGSAPWIPPKTPRVEAPAVGGGLGGAPMPAPAPVAQVVPIKPAMSVNGVGEQVLRRIKGRTDEEWFGPALGNVMLMRAEVNDFLAGLDQKPPVKRGASPEEAAMFIQQAAQEIMLRQIPIPAMIDLLMQGMVADFLDVLLPEAPQAYRDDVVKLLMTSADDDDEDDEDEDEDDDNEQPQAS